MKKFLKINVRPAGPLQSIACVYMAYRILSSHLFCLHTRVSMHSPSAPTAEIVAPINPMPHSSMHHFTHFVQRHKTLKAAFVRR